MTIEQAAKARTVPCDCGGQPGQPCIAAGGFTLPDTRTHIRRLRAATGETEGASPR